jgi:uncharacterized membrane protein YcaP (DUF421 family)
MQGKMDTSAFFDGWGLVVRAAVLAIVGYLALVTIIRISGKRTLSKMNVFDFVFVVALGSTLAATILSHDVSLAEGLAAVACLILVQVVLSWIITRSETIERIVNGEPVLVFVHGRYLDKIMNRERITREEIKSAVREEGLESLADVEAIVLETDGTFSVVERHDREPTSLSDVKGYGKENRGERFSSRPKTEEPAS